MLLELLSCICIGISFQHFCSVPFFTHSICIDFGAIATAYFSVDCTFLSFFFAFEAFNLVVICVSQSSVDIKTVLSQLMDRLSNYAASSSEVLPEFLQVEAFSKLSNAIGKVKVLEPWNIICREVLLPWRSGFWNIFVWSFCFLSLAVL